MRRLLLLGLVLLVPRLLLAGNEVYGGAGLGYGTVKVDVPIGTFEGASILTKLNAGARFGDYFAVEAGYVWFGDVDDNVRSDPALPAANRSLDTQAYDVFLLASYPLDPELLVFGKLGLAGWDADFQDDDGGFAESQDGTDLAWGLGFDFRGTNRLRVRVEVEFFEFDFAQSYWATSASLIYAFPLKL